jgi:hypothetical protein
MEELCKLLDIEKTHSTSLRPQANGLIEVFNKTLISMLKAYCSDQQNCWDTYLQQVMMAYRSSPHSSSKFSPNKMVFGREITLPMHAFIGRPKPENNSDLSEYVLNLEDKLKTCHDIARTNLKVAARYQKKHYDCKSRKRNAYSQGQLVWLHDPTRKVGVSSKLVNKWKGPFIVTRTVDDLVCMVKRTSTGKPKAYHIDRLYPYCGNKVPSWVRKEKQRYDM